MSTTTGKLHVGEETVIGIKSPSGRYQAVFEDDGTTGYFYAMDLSRSDNSICDALHIYNVKNVTDKHLPSDVQISWSVDGMKVLLLINNYPHAAFDFAQRRGYCRTNFPPPNEKWTNQGHEWDDQVLGFFVERGA